MKTFLGALAAFTILSLQPSAAQQPYWYPQQQYPPNNYYINQPYAPNQNESLRLSVNSPTNGSSFRGNFTLAGTGTPGAQVIVTGDLRGQTVVQGNGYWSMPLTLRGLAPGHTVYLQAFARDQYGRQSNTTELKYAVSY